MWADLKHIFFSITNFNLTCIANLTLDIAAVQLPTKSNEVEIRQDVEANGACVHRVKCKQKHVLSSQSSEIRVEDAHDVVFVDDVHHGSL